MLNDCKDRFGPGNKYKMRTDYKSYAKFKNITVQQSIDYLKDQNRGEFVIRPNPRGDNWLNLTLKLYENHIIHIEINEIKEGDKTKYKIGDMVFFDLTELECRFIKEMNKRVRELTSSPKFRKCCSFESFEESLREEAKADPGKIPYCFAILPNFPQHAVLGYVPGNDRSKVHSEYIKIKHNGFFFHDKIHTNLMQLVIFYKKNFQSRAYRKYVESTKHKQPTQRILTTLEMEPPAPIASEWQAEPLSQTPFPAKTTYVNDASQSDWNMSKHPGANFSTHEADSWGVKTERVKREGWGDDSGSQDNFDSQRDRRGGRGRGRGDRGGFRGRGRGGGGGGGDRG
jgi:uncharacterized membrane protein YgcG